jgi:hypothetical protein
MDTNLTEPVRQICDEAARRVAATIDPACTDPSRGTVRHATRAASR